MSEYAIRPATEDDLPELFRVQVAAVVGVEAVDKFAPDDVNPRQRFALRTGDLRVAVDAAGRIGGLITVIARDGVLILAQLFVHPDVQSAGLGRRLLEVVLPDDGRPRGCIATPDLRGTALYIRAGMTPRWPHYCLSALNLDAQSLPDSGVEIVDADIDADFLDWDREISGRYRPEDHEWWRDDEGGQPLWFVRGGERIGYGWIHDWPSTSEGGWFTNPYTVSIGALGARTADDARDCLLAAARHAAGLSERIRLEIGGPHPALPALLRSGFRIDEVETAMFSHPARFGDPTLYLPSGGVLY